MKEEQGAYGRAGLFFRYAGISDSGCARDHNDDNFVVQPECNFFAVADGVGSLPGSASASALALDCISQKLAGLPERPSVLARFLGRAAAERRHILEDIIQKANAAIRAGNLAKQRKTATTLTALFVSKDAAIMAHAGDSRLYAVLSEHIVQLTSDHTLRNAMLAANRRADVSLVPANIITRALGAEERIRCDFQELPLEEKACFLLCTDGLSGMLDDAAIADIVCDRSQDAAERVRHLIEQANLAGGRDNITALLVEMRRS